MPKTSHSTPFFSGFSSILFGRQAITEIQKTLRKFSKLNLFSDFYESFRAFIPDRLLQRRDTGANSRQRKFSLHVTFWAFLAQTLAPSTSCRDILRKIQAWRIQRDPNAPLGSASTSAYAQARQRLNADAITDIASHLSQQLESRVEPSQLWRGRHVRIADGSTVSMPDTPENQAIYPQSRSQKPGCGFPLMRIVALFSLATGALLGYAKSNKHIHESILFTTLIGLLKKGEILMADRGFCSFEAIWRMSLQGVDSVMRLNGIRKIDFSKGKILGPNDYLITWKKPTQRPKKTTPEDFAAMPESITLRHVKLEVSARGHRTQTIIIVTTLLDPIAYPAEALGKLYFQRWSIELHFREIKITLGMDVLRCKTPAMVEKEVMMHMISYNLIRAIMQRAANEHQVDLTRISFKGSVDTLRHWSPSLESQRGNRKKQELMLSAMLKLIATDLVPLRPDREEPRVKKRRAKNYQLMTSPRHEMKYNGHRNRPKQPLT